MNLSVMQPYLFPYIGYFQLIYASDIFLIYDDVSYIKQGYINRNTILSTNGPERFTVPVPGASSNKEISSLEFSNNVGNVLKMIQQSYSKAPYFEEVFPLVESVLTSNERSISGVCLSCYDAVFGYLRISRKLLKTSELEYDRNLSAKDRLIVLCHKFGADRYINAPGGRSLYSKTEFRDAGIDLQFINSLTVKYPQKSDEFVPNLSIIDVLMNCSPDETKKLLSKYELE